VPTLAGDPTQAVFQNVRGGTYTFSVTGASGFTARFAIEIDKTIQLPQVNFSVKNINGKKVNGGVRISGITADESGTATVTLNGEVIVTLSGAGVEQLNGMKFTQDGHYVVTVTDTATGGSSVTEFDIHQKLTGGYVAFSTAAAPLAAGGIMFAGFRLRKRRI